MNSNDNQYPEAHAEVSVPMARRLSGLGRSVIQGVTVLARELGALNLAEGFPDFDAPPSVVAAAQQAMAEGINQYFPSDGDPLLKQAVVAAYQTQYGLTYDPRAEVTMTCGATEAIAATVLSLVNPGDEVIIFEPFFEIYPPAVAFAGGIPRYVPLEPGTWRLDEGALAAAFNANTKLVILNTPHNPTGRVFTRDELMAVARLCQHWGVPVLMDEVYDLLTYDGAEHVSMASLPGMRPWTITVGALSKRYNVTGWRVGWALAPAAIASGIQKVNDYLTAGPASPLQRGAVGALTAGAEFIEAVRAPFVENRRTLIEGLRGLGYSPEETRSEGTYFVYTPVAPLGFQDDLTCAETLIREAGVAIVPCRGCFQNPQGGQLQTIRWTFSKRPETMRQALDQLQRWQQR